MYVWIRWWGSYKTRVSICDRKNIMQNKNKIFVWGINICSLMCNILIIKKIKFINILFVKLLLLLLLLTVKEQQKKNTK